MGSSGVSFASCPRAKHRRSERQRPRCAKTILSVKNYRDADLHHKCDGGEQAREVAGEKLPWFTLGS